MGQRRSGRMEEAAVVKNRNSAVCSVTEGEQERAPAPVEASNHVHAHVHLPSIHPNWSLCFDVTKKRGKKISLFHD